MTTSSTSALPNEATFCQDDDYYLIDQLVNGVYVTKKIKKSVIKNDVINEPVNAQIGTSYTYVTADNGRLVTHNNASAIMGTLPQAGIAFPNGWKTNVKNIGIGVVTITPATSLINGATSITLATGIGVTIISDGTNYFTKGGVSLNTVNIWTKSQTVAPVINTSVTGTYTPDLSLSNTFRLTFTGNVTFADPINPSDGQTINFEIIQDATGSRTLTKSSKMKTPGGSELSLSTDTGSIDLISCTYDASNSIYLCNLSKGYV